MNLDVIFEQIERRFVIAFMGARPITRADRRNFPRDVRTLERRLAREGKQLWRGWRW